MKYRIQLILMFFLLSCSSANQRNISYIPGWYSDHSQIKDYEIVGFGKGKTENEAKNLALEEIARTIRTEIRSEVRVQTKASGDSNDGTISQTEFHSELKAKSDVLLSNVRLWRKEFQEGNWFIALKYENLTLAQKLKISSKGTICADLDKSKNNNYLNKTPLLDNIDEEIGCKPSLRLIRRDGIWQILHQQKFIPLSPAEFEKLFVELNNPRLDVRPSSTELKEGNLFSFEISCFKDGYLSFFTAYENGQVFGLVQNQEVKGNIKTTIPDPDGTLELMAGLLKKGKMTKELFVAIWSPERLSVSRFVKLGQEIEEEELLYKFDELLALVNEHDASTVVLYTRPD